MTYKKNSICLFIVSFFSLICFFLYSFFNAHLYLILTPLVCFLLILILVLLFIINIINNAILYQKLKFIPLKKRNKILIKLNEGFITKIKNYFFKKNTSRNYVHHDFDGIKELNNEIPKWWLNIFYFSIFFSLIYLSSYFFNDFSDQEKEYKIEYNQHIASIINYEKKKPQCNINTTSYKKEYINNGKLLFQENCAICHNSDGGGNIGPNLTDKYWINIKNQNLFKNIFYIIWNGSENNKTMRPFGASGELKGNDIEKISSYIYYINTNPIKPLKGKKPEGKEIKNWEYSQ